LPYAGVEGLKRLDEYWTHKDPQFRVTAFRALRRAAATPPVPDAVRDAFKRVQEALCTDSSPAVRREVALSLRDEPWDRRSRLLVQLANRYDGWDRWYLESIGLACEGHEAEAYALFVTNSGVSPLEWDRRLAGLAWRLHPVTSIDALTERAMFDALPTADRERTLTTLAFIADQRAAESMLRIAKEGPADLRGTAAWWGKHRATNDWEEYAMGDQFPEPPPVRQQAKWSTPRHDFALSGAPEFSSDGKRVEVDVDIRGAHRIHLIVEKVLDTKQLATLKLNATAKKKPKTTHLSINASWSQPRLLSGDQETKLVDLEWMAAFGNGQFIAKDGSEPIEAWDRRIKLLPPVIDQQADVINVGTRSIITYDVSNKGFQRFRAEGRSDEDVRFSIHVDRSPAGESLPSVQDMMAVEGESSHGRALFLSDRLSCSNCHSAAGFGGGVGPDLTNIAQKHAPEVMLEGIVNPSAAISTGFETMTVLTVDGTLVSGLTVSAGDPVVLKDASGKNHAIAQDDIEEMLASKNSMMPELKNQLTAQEVASLLAFLREMQMN
ncbi:MAG: hypothetical protein AAF989_06060, partial [Planctomycetota bacterium]